jgi:hypothetical protein
VKTIRHHEVPAAHLLIEDTEVTSPEHRDIFFVVGGDDGGFHDPNQKICDEISAG